MNKHAFHTVHCYLGFYIGTDLFLQFNIKVVNLIDFRWPFNGQQKRSIVASSENGFFFLSLALFLLHAYFSLIVSSLLST